MNISIDYSKYSQNIFVVGKEKSKKLLKLIKPKPSLKKIVPLLDWLPGYIWKEWFAGDLVSGMTLAVLQLPQVNSFHYKTHL